jgi:Uma2 family endonuclease
MSVAAPPPPPTRFGPYAALRRFSVAEYERLIDIGILTDEDKVELLDGYVVLKMPRNPPHDSRIQKLNRLILALLPSGWDVRIQLAVTLATSVPEPDVAIVRGDGEDYASRHPSATDVRLVVEVAESSLDHDRGEKGPIYADAGLPTYWIVNLIDRQVEVYTGPTGSGQSAAYARRQDYRSGDSIPLALDGRIVGQLAVSDILP